MATPGRCRLHGQLCTVLQMYSRDLGSDSGGMVSLFLSCICRSVHLTPAYLHGDHGLDYALPSSVIDLQLTNDAV